jgi:hypothetical protein
VEVAERPDARHLSPRPVHRMCVPFIWQGRGSPTGLVVLPACLRPRPRMGAGPRHRVLCITGQ